MRAIAPVGHRSSRSASAGCANFFVLRPYRRHIRRKHARSAPRVMRQTFNPLLAVFWCIVVPFFAGWFWYTIIGLIRALVSP